MSIQVSGVLGLLILIFDIWAIVQTLQSPASSGTKVMWIVLILLLPFIGLVLWFFLGPRTRAAL